MDQGLYFTKKKQNRSNSWLQQPLFYQEPPFSSSRKVNKGINEVSDDRSLCTVLKPIIWNCFLENLLIVKIFFSNFDHSGSDAIFPSLSHQKNEFLKE